MVAVDCGAFGLAFDVVDELVVLAVPVRVDALLGEIFEVIVEELDGRAPGLRRGGAGGEEEREDYEE